MGTKDMFFSTYMYTQVTKAISYFFDKTPGRRLVSEEIQGVLIYGVYSDNNIHAGMPRLTEACRHDMIDQKSALTHPLLT